MSGRMSPEIVQVSLVLLCRNEERNLESCLHSIEQAVKPLPHVEVLIVDGESSDESLSIARKFTDRLPGLKILNNPKRIAPTGMNIGLQASKGDIVFMLGAHTTYSENYFKECLDVMNLSGAVAVGGCLKIESREISSWGSAIKLFLGSPEVGGPSRHRMQSDERMLRSLDTEFNRRLRKSGGRIAIASRASATYFSRSHPYELSKYYFVNGEWLFRPLAFNIRAFELRHLAPLVLVLGALVSASWMMGLYAIYLIYASRGVKNFKARFYLVAITAIVHLSAGVGSLWGLISLPFHRFRRIATP